MTTSRTGEAHGLTLVEVLVSLAILGLASVTVLQALARIAHTQALTSYQADAYLFAVEKLGGVEVAFREGKGIKDRDTGSVRVGPHAFQWELTASPMDAAAPAASGEPAAIAPVRAVSLSVRWHASQQDYSREFETRLRPPLPKES